MIETEIEKRNKFNWEWIKKIDDLEIHQSFIKDRLNEGMKVSQICKKYYQIQKEYYFRISCEECEDLNCENNFLQEDRGTSYFQERTKIMTTQERKKLIKKINRFGGKARTKDSTLALKKKLEKTEKSFYEKRNPYALTLTQRNRNKRRRKKLAKKS